MPYFFDLNVHAYPESEAIPEELLRITKRYGYAGMAITNHDDAINEEMHIDSIFSGVEVRGNSISELKRKIRDYRKKVLVLAVHGGPENINKAALRDPRVDILAHPFEGEGNLSPILVRYAVENNIAIEFNMNVIIHSRGVNRVRKLRKMLQNLKLARKYKAKMIITSNAHSIYDIRAPREMIAIASLFGMSKEDAISALCDVPEGIISKKWKREKEVVIIS